jgi:hypothetical protein
VPKIWLFAAAMPSAGLILSVAPTAKAWICGSVRGRHVDVSGRADPLSELNGDLELSVSGRPHRHLDMGHGRLAPCI